MADICINCWHPKLPMEPVQHTGPCPDWALSFEEACWREDAIEAGHHECNAALGDVRLNNGDRTCHCGERFKSFLGDEGLLKHLREAR